MPSNSRRTQPRSRHSSQPFSGKDPRFITVCPSEIIKYLECTARNAIPATPARFMGRF